MNPNFSAFEKIIASKLKFKFFLFVKLPMAFFAGLGVSQFSNQQATVAVKFKWINQNPFQSIYFAVLSMAAELSTGVLCFAQVYKRTPKISMLVSKVEAEFIKKAVGKISFTCTNGNDVINAINESIQTGKGTTVICKSIGINEQNEVVANFAFTWSFKCKA